MSDSLQLFANPVLQLEYWRGLPFSSPGDLPNPGIKPMSPALQADSLPAEPLGKSLTSPASLELAGGFFTTEPDGKPLISLNATSNHFQTEVHI